MLHVKSAWSHAIGVPKESNELAEWDVLAMTIRAAQKQQDQSLELELDGLNIQCMLVEGEPAWAIVQTAQDENADLIMMPSHGFTFDQFLLGSVTAKVLHRTECPVWTDAHVERSPAQKFAIRNVLCAVDFGSGGTTMCRGLLKLLPNLELVLRSLMLQPGWSFGGQAANLSIKTGKGAR
jgi:hypothetical protein